MTDPQELVGETLSVHLNLTRGDYVLKGAPKGPVLAYARTVTLEVVTLDEVRAIAADETLPADTRALAADVVLMLEARAAIAAFPYPRRLTQ